MSQRRAASCPDKIPLLTSRRSSPSFGDLYPFSLRDKLACITDNSSWYDPSSADRSPWGDAIVPFEMISVLANYTADRYPFPVAGGAIGLFADQEIHLLNGPLLVGQAYELDREIVALSGSRRTESMWIRTCIYSPEAEHPVAEMLLNQAYLRSTEA